MYEKFLFLWKECSIKVVIIIGKNKKIKEYAQNRYHSENDKVEVKQYYENNKENLWNQSEIVTENIL